MKYNLFNMYEYDPIKETSCRRHVHVEHSVQVN